ncbi:hypothetical protein V5799_029115 [Amblyomma americanum]|uniref:Uncharacterized protein n=1 Tax=Amblyomma americanum TaxID=6943 RepID=A0AAQ4ES37_AMBAM
MHKKYIHFSSFPGPFTSLRGLGTGTTLPISLVPSFLFYHECLSPGQMREKDFEEGKAERSVSKLLDCKCRSHGVNKSFKKNFTAVHSRDAA